jgi:hypothetical protein
MQVRFVTIYHFSKYVFLIQYIFKSHSNTYIKVNEKDSIFWNIDDALFWYKNQLRVPVPSLIQDNDFLDEDLAEKAIVSAYGWFKKQKNKINKTGLEMNIIEFDKYLYNISDIEIDSYNNKGFRIRTESIIPWNECKIYLHKDISDKIRKIITPKMEKYSIILDNDGNNDFFYCPLHWYTKDLNDFDKLIAFYTVMNYNNLVLKNEL